MWSTKELHLKVCVRASMLKVCGCASLLCLSHVDAVRTVLAAASSHAAGEAGLRSRSSRPVTAALLVFVCRTLARAQTVDRFNNLFVTAYVTPSNARFLLLHDGKGDEAIRAFFTEVHELYLRVRRCAAAQDTPRVAWCCCASLHHRHRATLCCCFLRSCVLCLLHTLTHARAQVMLNPFHSPSTRITSKAFDGKVKVLARRLLA